MIIKLGHDIDEGAMLGIGAEAGRASLRRRSNEGQKEVFEEEERWRDKREERGWRECIGGVQSVW
jgi:hypothetical protein